MRVRRNPARSSVRREAMLSGAVSARAVATEWAAATVSGARSASAAWPARTLSSAAGKVVRVTDSGPSVDDRHPADVVAAMIDHVLKLAFVGWGGRWMRTRG